ncbi:MAG TPA: PDZ domain-containing protein [Terracidiphilus sp.]|nr:PDZ domain-containing protein [Terracidiphilus sp.]
MNYLLRPYQSLGLAVIPAVIVAAGLAMVPQSALAQSNGLGQLMDGSTPLLVSGSQGYLGVELADVDAEKAQVLKLKEVRGAIITLIDHDAPAGQIGLKVNDVVLQLNGQNVEGSEQLRRLLKEIPPGRKVSIEISRDGNIQTMAVELADRQVLGHDVWNNIGTGGEVTAPPPSMGILSGGGDAPPAGGGFHLPFFGSSLNVGVMVEPLTSQMAEYLGVPSGLMVKQVARKSEAAAAGLKAFDVILKVGSEPVTNLAGWDRALRSSQGKPVQVTVLRDKKQLTLTLQVDSKHKGSMEIENIFPSSDCPLMAELSQEFAQNPVAAAAAAEALRNSLNPEDFKIDPKQMEQLRKQMYEFSKNFTLQDFTLDPKQMEQVRQQMDEFRKNFNSEDFKIDPKQMDELKRQIEEMLALQFGNYV